MDNMMTSEEEINLTLEVMARVLEREQEGGVYGITLSITEFGNLMPRPDGGVRLAERQTLVFDNADGRTYCVCDGGMTAGEHLLYFDDYLQMKGVVRALSD